MSRTFVIIHGWSGSPAGHWQDWLHKKLLEAGENVVFPKFPENERPSIEKWLETLNNILKMINDEKIVISHSLGSVLWLHYAMRNYRINVKRLLLVAPPGEKIISETEDMRSFSGIDITEERLKKSAEIIRFAATENDEYCIENAIEFYAKRLNLDYDVLPPEKGHINMKSGYGPWESVLNWCFDENIRIIER